MPFHAWRWLEHSGIAICGLAKICVQVLYICKQESRSRLTFVKVSQC